MPKATADAVQRFEELLPEGPGVTQRLVFGFPTAFVHGNMFFGVFGPDLFVRLSDEDRLEIMRIEGAVPFEPMKGRPMASYVLLPAAVLERPEKAERWVRRSQAWAGSLPTKPPGGAGRKSKVPTARPPAARKARKP